MNLVQLIIEVPEERATFMLELLESIRFIRNPRLLHESEADEDAQEPDEAAQPTAT